jgi:hypothetical protein
MKFILMCVLTFGAASAGTSTVRACGWPYWAYHVLVISVGVVLYLVNNFLIVGLVRRRAPDFASDDEVMPGVQKWELTAGTGIVPKWVSFIGLLSIAFVLASPFELVAWLMRTMQK